MPHFGDLVRRILFGHDVFISYSRADSATFAAGLAGELTALGFLCRLDQWGAAPGKDVPEELLRDLRNSSMLVVIGSAAATGSSAVEREIREFLLTKRFIVPVNIDGHIRSARWWPLLEGLAVVEESLATGGPPAAPSPDTIARIQNTATFIRRTVLLRWLIMAALVVFAVLVGLLVFAGKRVTKAVQLAATETARAQAATNERIAAEKKREEVLAQLKTTEAVAESRELARHASAQTENQARLQTAIRAAETEPTDAAREALTNAIVKVMDAKGHASFAVDTTGNLVAVAGRHGQGVLVDLNSGKMTQLCGSPEPLGELSFSPNSRYLLTTRYHHKLGEISSAGDRIPRYAHEYQLWDTTAGTPLGSAVVEGTPFRVRWSPNSSMFVVFQNLASGAGQAYRMSIGPSGTLNAIEQPALPDSVYDLDILFSKDRQLFLMYSRFLAGASLWDYHGNKLWSSPEGRVQLAAFRNRTSGVIVVLRPDVKEREEIETLDIDPLGRPGRSAKAFWSEVDYHTFIGSQLPRPWYGLDSKDVSAVGGHTCTALSVNLDVGLALCSQDKSAPMLFDNLAHKPLGDLKEWAFEDVKGGPALSSDGKTLVIASGLHWLTAWNTTTRELQWKQKADLVTPEFSADGKRILLRFYTSPNYGSVLDAQTGKTISNIPQGPLIWINRSATRLMVPQGSPFSDSNPETLVLWDVDRSTELRRFGLSMWDKGEEDRDRASLKGSPSLSVLLEIAHRRLRACDGKTKANPYVETLVTPQR